MLLFVRQEIATARTVSTPRKIRIKHFMFALDVLAGIFIFLTLNRAT